MVERRRAEGRGERAGLIETHAAILRNERPRDISLYNLSSELDGVVQESPVFVIEKERRFFGLPSVGNQTGDKVDDKVSRAAVTGVFNL